MKKLFVTLFVATVSFLAANAQENLSTPYWFVGAKGGVSMPLEHDLSKILYTMPNASLSVGKMFNPQIGARINVTRDFKSDEQKNMYTAEPTSCREDFTVDVDALLNLSTLFGKKDYYPFNVYMIAGLGWDHLGGGLMAEYNIAKNISVAAETTLNSHKVWRAGLGLNFKFGAAKKKVKPAPVVVAPEPVYATRIDTVWYNDTEYKTKAVTGDFTCNDHFALAKTEPINESVIAKVADFYKTYKNVKVEVTGYADKGTGNPTINMTLSQKRAETVAEALKAAGVPAEVMTVDWKGDTVQPFEENDENRAVIIKVSGETEEKYPVTVKKFRTEEVRYEVK